MDGPGDATYTEMRWNAPLSEEHAEQLLTTLGVTRAATVLDLGCGWGELLLRAVAAGDERCHGTGVDTEGPLLARGRAAATRRGLQDRVSFVQADASTWRGSADITLCIGAAHAWGGAAQALGALHAAVTPTGRVLYGDGCWTTEPTDAARAIFGDSVLAPAALERAVTAAGWELIESSPTSPAEFDEFEASFRAGRERWAADRPDDPRAAEVAAEMARRREEYESVYRGVLGFTYLVLAPAAWT